MDGLDLFNDDTRPSVHISRPDRMSWGSWGGLTMVYITMIRRLQRHGSIMLPPLQVKRKSNTTTRLTV